MRFSLRTILIATAMAACGLAYGVHVYRFGQRQKAGFRAGHDISGFVDLYYDYEVDWREGGFPAMKKQPPPLPEFVYRWIPEPYLHRLVAVEVTVSDDDVRQLLPLADLPCLQIVSSSWNRYADGELEGFREFRQMTHLDLSVNTNLTDVGLRPLAELDQLRVLKIDGDDISKAAIEQLRKAIPRCEINGRRFNAATKAPRTEP